ncbi:MAG: DUF488 family protein [Cucumibacter sp.]
MIRTKSVYSPIHRPEDGLRILITRFRGHGLKSSRYDVWMANLAPSERLLRSFWNEEITWSNFARGYRRELKEGGTIDRRNKTIKNHGQKFTLRLIQTLGRKGTITLMCHCEENQHRCHRFILQSVLNGNV